MPSACASSRPGASGSLEPTSTIWNGQPGNFAIAGHRVTHGSPFRKLLELRKGDEVIVETGDAVYTYELDGSPRDLT